MDPRQLRSKKLSKPQIWDSAEQFREDYIGNCDIPVNIENIAERIGIAMVLIPGINSKLGMDGFLSNDLKCLYLDKDLYEDEENRYEPRIRFTIAHELGHYYLHREQIDSLIEHTRNARSSVLKSLSWNSNPISREQLINMVAPLICGHFNVSSEVIEKRLHNDIAFLHLGI